MYEHGYRWKIETINDTQYLISLIYKAEGRVLKKLFEQTKKKLEKKRGIAVKGQPEEIEEFKIPQEQKKVFFPLIYRATKKHLKATIKEASSDKIKCITGELHDVIYIKDKEGNYTIKVIYKGDYVRE